MFEWKTHFIGFLFIFIWSKLLLIPFPRCMNLNFHILNKHQYGIHLMVLPIFSLIFVSSRCSFYISIMAINQSFCVRAHTEHFYFNILLMISLNLIVCSLALNMWTIWYRNVVYGAQMIENHFIFCLFVYV